MDVEEKLLSRLRLSEEEALRRLVTHRHVKMICIAMGYVAGRHGGEEVETNLYVRLQRARDGYGRRLRPLLGERGSGVHKLGSRSCDAYVINA